MSARTYSSYSFCLSFTLRAFTFFSLILFFSSLRNSDALRSYTFPPCLIEEFGIVEMVFLCVLELSPILPDLDMAAFDDALECVFTAGWLDYFIWTSAFLNSA